MIAVASVVLVITPISWILLHQPQNDNADASIPIVTRTDDTYVTPTNKPVVNPPTSRASTPPATPSATPTPTPTDSATPTSTPSSSEPTERPTSSPTEDRTTTAPTEPTPTSDRPTTSTQPTQPPTTNTPPPPPEADGGMNSDELQLFNMIDRARVNNGCARLEQDPNLTGGARSEAEDRAESGSVNSYTSSKTTSGGNSYTAQQAFDQMMAQSRSVVLNCNLKTLGVGRDTARYCSDFDLLGFCIGSRPTRVSWVADFT